MTSTNLAYRHIVDYSLIRGEEICPLEMLMVKATSFALRSLAQKSAENPNPEKHIGLVISQQCSMAVVGIVMDAFRLANELARSDGQSSSYGLSLLSSSGGMVDISFDLSMLTKRLDHFKLTDFHALFVACFEDDPGTYSEFSSWLSHQRSVISEPVASKRAFMGTTCVSSLSVLVFEDPGDGFNATRKTLIDMVLAQIGRDLGIEAGQRIARVLGPSTVEQVRIDDLGLTTRQKIFESARWIRKNYGESISVANAAEHAAMSKRNYLRRFKAEFGITPLEYLLQTRFDAVCSMLEDTDLPIDKVARWCGMGDGNRLGRIFKQRIGMSPTQYRAHKHMAKSIAAISGRP